MRAKLILLILCAFSIVVRAEPTNSAADSTKTAPAPKSADQIFDFSTSKLAGYKTWSADIAQTVNMFGSDIVIKGTMIQKQPHNMRMQMDMPMLGQQAKMNTVLGDDGILWQEMDMAGRKQIMKMDMVKAMSNVVARTGMKIDPLKAMDPSQQWAANREMMNYTSKGVQTLNGQPLYVVEGTWKVAAQTNRQIASMAASLGKAVIYIGQDDGFVHRYEQYPKTGTNTVMSIELSNVKFNQDVPDNLFKFQPPPGVQIMDMTAMAASASGNPSLPPTAPASIPAPAPPVAPRDSK